MICHIVLAELPDERIKVSLAFLLALLIAFLYFFFCIDGNALQDLVDDQIAY